MLAGGFCAVVSFCSLVAVPAADCEPAPTLLDGVWLLTGGVDVEVLLEAELVAGAGASWFVVDGEVAAGALLAGLLVLLCAWELSAGFMLLEEAVELGLADVPAAAWPPPVQESEIILMEVTCSEPPLDWVPCTST